MGGWSQLQQQSVALMALAAFVLLPASPACAQLAAAMQHGAHQPSDWGPRAHASIVGGKPAAQGMFPWLAYVADKRGQIIDQCTGTVVAPNLVLTAGHCAEDMETEVERDPTGYIVVTGNVDWTSPEAQVSLVSEVIVYPGFHGGTSGVGDAALLVLSTPTTAPAISLGTAEPGTPARIAGWGSTYAGQPESPNTLQWAEATVQSFGWCKQHKEPFSAAAELCALDENLGSGACQGDSGGPLIAESPSGPVELGVYDRGVTDCSPSYAGSYAAAALIAPWVREAIRALAPLVQPPGSPLAESPGRYVTVRSRVHRVALRVSGAGRQLVLIEIKATINCQHGGTFEPEYAWLSSRERVAIHNHAARVTLGTRATRYFWAGRFGVYLRFNSAGYAEGVVSVSMRAKDRRIGLCSARAIRFIAHPASG